MQVPIPDMANLENGSIWPDVEAQLVDLVEALSSAGPQWTGHFLPTLLGSAGSCLW